MRIALYLAHVIGVRSNKSFVTGGIKLDAGIRI